MSSGSSANRDRGERPSRRARPIVIEERLPPATTPLRIERSPTALDRAMRWTGLAWLAEVRTHSARRRLTPWEKARDTWSAAALLLAVPMALLLGRVVVATETYALLEGVVYRPPPRAAGVPAELGLDVEPEWGVAEDLERQTVAVAGCVGPGARGPTARGTVLGSFLIERDVVVGGLPFAHRLLDRRPAILLYDHAAGRSEPLAAAEILGHRHLEIIATAIEESLANMDLAEQSAAARSASAERPAATPEGTSLAAGRRLIESGVIARMQAEAALKAIRTESWSGLAGASEDAEASRTEWPALAANSLVTAVILFVGGLAVISVAQFTTFVGRGMLAVRRERRRRSNLCPRCGHDVRANVMSARCPECGELLY
ncbi:MAG: hypothetical protein ACO3YY_00245 [Phycisphaerales bacterium]